MNRRVHTKSRRGCFYCKQKRIKCDEKKNSCTKCTKLKLVCTYPSETPLVWPKETPGDSRTTSTLSPIASLPSTHDSSTQTSAITVPDSPPVDLTTILSLNLNNVDLIIHWFTKTVHTTSPPAAIPTCQTLILSEAMEHPFLLHGLLAFTALHRADDGPDRVKYTNIATAHHTQGLALFHRVLSKLSATTFTASIAFSSLVVMFSFAFSRPKPARTLGTELIDAMGQIILLTKGWHHVVKCVENERGFPLSAPKPTEIIKLSDEEDDALARLEALNTGYNMELYSPAIKSMRTGFQKLAGGELDNPHIATQWVENLPEGFVILMRERSDLAMIILGYYCVLLSRVPQVWWLKGWSQGLFDVIWNNTEGHVKEFLMVWVRKCLVS